MTHGFFIIMGGFHLFERSSDENSGTQSISQEGDSPLHPLLASNLMRDDIYTFTMPTQEEIKDKGKSDWLAKSLVLLQTSWFVLQCIARAIKYLPVTHLEIVTLAYAAVNFVIYVFWWNKPLNVNRPVRVFRKSGESEPRETHPQVKQPISEALKLTWEIIGEGLLTILKCVLGGQDENVELSHEDRVPRFWANSTSEGVGIAAIIVLGVGVCFGAIHCIAWFFPCPTHPELSIWQISSAATTAVPFYVALMAFLAARMDNTEYEMVGGIAGISILPASILYIFAWVVTLVFAFTSLRDLPPGKFDTVHWTTFIPHV